MSTNISKRFCVLFIVIVFFLVFSISLILLPKATITLQLDKQPFTYNFKISLNAQTKQILDELNIIPARILTGNFYSKQEIKAQMPEDYLLLDGLIEFSSQTFSKRAMIFSKSDLDNLIQAQVKAQLENNQQILPDSYEQIIEVFSFQPDLQKAELIVYIKAYLVPAINIGLLKKFLRFKNIEQANNYISETENVAIYDIEIWPKFFWVMPISEKRIEIRLR